MTKTTAIAANPRSVGLGVTSMLLIVVAGLGAYANSFWGDWILDDYYFVVNNETIRDWRTPLRIFEGEGRTRPLVYLTFMANYAAGEYSPLGYHLVNLMIHLGNALLLASLLFGIFKSPRLAPLAIPPRVAVAAALLWVVHPAGTQAVTYIYQRNESLASTFYLLAAWCFVQSRFTAVRTSWLLCSVVSAAMGMLTKEIVFTAPLLIYFIDSILFSETFQKAWQNSKAYYSLLFATWLIPVAMLIIHRKFYGEKGLLIPDESVPTPFKYLYSQGVSILYYLSMTVAPLWQSFDPGWRMPEPSLGIPCFLVVGFLVALTLYGLARRRVWSLFGLAYFLLLAASSSLAPIRDLMFEHRTYLAIAAPLLLLLFLLQSYLQCRMRVGEPMTEKRVFWGVVFVACLALGLGTHFRNRLYYSTLDMYTDNVAKSPWWYRVRNGLGNAYLKKGELQIAEKFFREAIDLAPKISGNWQRLGITLKKQGRLAESIECYRTAAKLVPQHAGYQWSLVALLSEASESDADADEELRQMLQKAVQDDPGFDHAQLELAKWELRHNQIDQARQRLNALNAKGIQHSELFNNLGALYAQEGNIPQALIYFEKCMRLIGGSAEQDALNARVNYARALEASGRLPDAEQQLLLALRLNPHYGPTNGALARLLSGRDPKTAEKLFQAAIQSDLSSIEARFNYALFLARNGRRDEAKTVLAPIQGAASQFPPVLDLLHELNSSPSARTTNSQATVAP